MKIAIFFLTFCSMICSSCNKERNIIPVIDTKSDEVAPVNLSAVFELVNQVKLQDTDPLITRIDKVIKTEDFIFVNDVAPDWRLLQFDKNGNFIKRIGRQGNGPGEHRGIGDFTIDDENNVYITTFRKLLSYNAEGNFLNSCPAEPDKFKSFQVSNITYRENCLWSFQFKALVPDENNRHDTYICDLVRYDKSLRPIDTTVLLRAFYNVEFYNNIKSDYLSDLGGDIYAYIPIGVAEPFLRDTLYELKGLKKKPVLKFDFSAILYVDANADKKVNSRGQEILDARFKVNNLFIKGMIRTKRYIFIRYNIIWEDFLFCYDLEDKRVYNMSKGFTDDMTGSTSVIDLMPIQQKTGEFCFVKNGYELNGIVNGVNENSNPVIFFVKTRE